MSKAPFKDRVRMATKILVGAHTYVKDHILYKPTWTIYKCEDKRQYLEWRKRGEDDSYLDDKLVTCGNMILDEGVTALHNLLVGAAETSFAQANAYIGVGDSNAAENATQTGLQAASNKYYQACDGSYPTLTNQTSRWRGVFQAANGNFAWEEITVANGNSDASDNLNRHIQSMGTKASPAVWTVDLDIEWG